MKLSRFFLTMLAVGLGAMLEAKAQSRLATELAPPPLSPTAGGVNADDFPTLQAAVDQLGETGGEVRLSARTYFLKETVRLKNRIRFQGIMDSKVRSSVTRIDAAPGFKGEWLFETLPVPAKANSDLNKDIFFFDVNVTGGEKISGIKALNVDGLRVERCRFASLRHGILVSQIAASKRPFHWSISPGGVFINNSIFRCNGTAIKLEYSTQNRIYANWFVTGTTTALHVKNSDKTWFFANELNAFSHSGITIEDDGLPGNPVTDLTLSQNWINAPDRAKKYLELLPNGKTFRRVQFVNNILAGDGSCDTEALASENSNRFADNLANGPGFASQATGEGKIEAGKTQTLIAHGLFRRPAHVTVTFCSEPPKFWVTDLNASTFTVNFTPGANPAAFTWSATVGN